MQAELNPKRVELLSSQIATEKIKTTSHPQLLSVRDFFVREVSPTGVRIPKKDFENEKDLLASLFGEHRPFSQKTNEEKVHHFCLTLIFDAYKQLTCFDELEIVYSKVQGMIAQVIFLSMENIEKVVHLLKSENPFEEIKKETELQFGNLKRHLHSASETLRKNSFSTLIKGETTLSSIQIAKVLILPNGRINRGFIPCFTHCAVQGKKVLTLLYQNPDLIKMIEEIKAPSLDNSHSQTLIRAMLDLPPHSTISHVEAKIVLLATLVYGPIGKSLKFCKLSWYYQTLMTRTIYDLSCLIQQGCLIRHEGERINHYPMVIKNYEEAENEIWRLDPSGQLENGLYLWELPGIQSACLQLGNQDCKSACEKALAALFGDQLVQKKISTSDFLHLLVQMISQNESAREEFNLALMAFNSRTEPLLLRVLTTTYASLVQKKKHDHIQQKLQACWDMTVRDILKEGLLPDDLDLPELGVRQKVLTTLSGVIQHKVLISVSMEPTSGFYELFENEDEVPIAELNDFNFLFRRAVKEFILPLEGENWSEKELSYLRHSFSKLNEAVGQKGFVNKLLSNFDPTLKKITNGKKQWKAFTRLPHVNQKEAWEISFGFPFPKGFQKKKKAENRVKEHSLPSWIKEQKGVAPLLVEQAMTCRPVLEDKITSKQVEVMSLEAEKFVSEELRKYFQEKIRRMKDRASTLTQFTREVLDLILQMNNVKSAEEVGQLTALLTHVVIQKVLTPDQVKILQDARIEYPKKLRGQFVFTINPVNGNLEVFQWKEELIPLNQDEWSQAPNTFKLKKYLE